MRPSARRALELAACVMLAGACSSSEPEPPYECFAQISPVAADVEITVDGEPATAVVRRFESWSDAKVAPRIQFRASKAGQVATFEVGPGDCFVYLHPTQELAEPLIEEHLNLHLVDQDGFFYISAGADYRCSDAHGNTAISVP